MGSPPLGWMPKRKSLQKGTGLPWRLHLPHLRVAVLHGHLQKVRVMLKIDQKTELFWDKRRIYDFRKMSRVFILVIYMEI
jgi:hypothetical protein